MLFGAELPEDFPERIEQLRRATGLSREAFAHCLSVDPRQLRQWMRGTKPAATGSSPSSRWRAGFLADSTCFCMGMGKGELREGGPVYG